jgi:hypothetical protein
MEKGERFTKAVRALRHTPAFRNEFNLENSYALFSFVIWGKARLRLE